MRSSSRIASSFVMIVALWGCGSEASSGGGCNSLVDDGPSVSFTAVATAPPAPSGGSFADGTYELSAMTLYTGPGGSTTSPAGTASAVFEITGQTMQQVGSIDGTEKRYTSTFTISGITVSTTDTCPAPDTGSHQFTATPAEFRIYDDTGSNGTLEQTYTRR